MACRACTALYNLQVTGGDHRKCPRAAYYPGCRQPHPDWDLPLLILVSLTAYSTAHGAAAALELPASAPPSLFGCTMFPANNIWNVPVDTLPVDTHSNAWISSIGAGTGLHMDFGSGTWDGGPIGIPYNAADAATPKYAVDFYYGDESDPGPYSIPASPLIEYSGDHHLLVVDQSTCRLYEMYDVTHNTNGSWSGGSGAVWDLGSNALRPNGWTSADAAGLPILPGLVRYDEVAAGEIDHAIRFTADSTNSYIWPARHLTSGTPGVLTSTPPMGARFRLKASFNISGYPADMQVILRAMKKYGIILADNGSDWFISGAPDPRWDNDMLHLLDGITGSNFEAVNASGLQVSVDSGATNVSITISGNAGIGAAAVTYTGGSTTADGGGHYSITVPSGWSGTVTPSKAGSAFRPEHRDYANLTADQPNQDYAAGTVSVRIGAPLAGVYNIPGDDSTSDSYASLLDGPVKVKDENGFPIFASQAVTSGSSYNETMGYPVDQFTTDYWFPFYDHGYPTVGGDNVRTWILVGNPSDSTDAHVNIYIGGALQSGSPFTISPGSRVTPRLDRDGRRSGARR